MDWTVYRFMLPVCIVIAGVAMFSGISGAAMLFPVFLIGFPLIGAPPPRGLGGAGCITGAIPGSVTVLEDEGALGEITG